MPYLFQVCVSWKTPATLNSMVGNDNQLPQPFEANGEPKKAWE